MPHRSLLIAMALLPACGPHATSTPDMAPFATPAFSHGARAGDMVIGGQPSPAALGELAARGFTTIVSTRTATELDWDEQAVVDSLGMRFVRIPIPLPLEPVTAAQVTALDSVLGAGEGPILLHCAAGTRAAVLWALWMAEAHGTDPRASLRKAAQAGVRLSEAAVARLLGEAER